MFRVGWIVVVVLAAAAIVGAAQAQEQIDEPQQLEAKLLRTYDAFDANQGVGVDDDFFYAVDNTTITKHSRRTGSPLLQFAGAEGGPLIHLDSGAIERSRIYASHSNYNESPMESSIEVFDARSMRHIDTHSFGIDRGSLTWIDRAPDGSWWAAFANYDRVFDGEVYGRTNNTQVVKMNERFEVVEAFTIPRVILDRFRPMSNSGGSWGPDGRLWITGHDLGEAYVMEPPRAGSELRWVATVMLPGVEGQGIAWDLDSRKPTLWAIKRSTKQVLQFEVPYRDISDQRPDDWDVNGPGEFVP